MGDELVSTFERGFSWDEPNWLPSLTRIPAGQHTLKWVYSKSLASKLDISGWLDDVQFYSEDEVVKSSISALGLDEATFEFGGQGMWVADKINSLDEGGGLTSSGVVHNGRAGFRQQSKARHIWSFTTKHPIQWFPGHHCCFHWMKKI